MTKVLNLNVAATALLGEMVKVRVRVKDDVLQIRPTDRVLGTNLPKGEVLRNVSFKKKGEKVQGAVINLKDIAGEPGTATDMVAGKYGWYSMVSTDAVAKGAAGGRIGVK